MIRRLLAPVIAALTAVAGGPAPAAGSAPADPVCELPDGSRVHPGTLQMAELLARLNASPDPRLHAS